MGMVNFLERFLFGVGTKDLDRAIAESEERQRIAMQKCIDKIPKELNELETGLMELEKAKDKDERWKLGSKISENSRMVNFYISFALPIIPIKKDIYNRTIQLLQRASETFESYTDLKIFSDFSRDKRGLIETANKYQPELNQNCLYN